MWIIFIALSGAWLVSAVEFSYPEELSVGDDISPPFRFRQTDMETMVDLTNNLGVAILQDHSYSKGNFAFSPYGVASVLVVLYEGARGESAIQIRRAFGFPWNKDAIRVGFREIHQHLGSYFSHEGYLSGINLSKDQSSLKPEFKKILRVYGYDVELDDESPDDLGSQDGSSSSGNETVTVPTTPPSVTEPQDVDTTTEDQSTTESNLEEVNETTTKDQSTTESNVEEVNETTTKDQSTTESNVEEVNETTTKDQSTTESKLEVNETTIPPTTTTTTTTSEEHTSNATVTATTEEQNPPTTTPKEETSTQSESTIKLILLEYTTKPTEKTVQETVPPTEKTVQETVSPTSQSTDSIIVDINDRVHISLTIDSDCRKRGKRTGEDSDCPTRDDEGKTGAPKTDTNLQKITLGTVSNDIAKLDNKMLIPQAGDPLTLSPGESTWTQTSKRESRRSLATAVVAKSSIEMSGISKREVSNIRKILSQKVHLWTAPEPREIKVRKSRTITDYLKQRQTGELSLQLQNGMYDTHVSRDEEAYQKLPRKLFLVDGVIDTPVPMMSYTYVFPYAYLPKLRAKAMEFPLDDTRYKLLILLPVDRRGLRRVIYDLMDYPLRHVLDSMRPAKVKATIPTFMVEGFVILTSSLKKLGIRDVFDPRKANLSGMSADPELYVRNVEQSVTVVIRNYVEILDIETRTTAARYIDYDFEATHPFLYFVLDTATNVALMTGQMLDPLNSRIY